MEGNDTIRPAVEWNELFGMYPHIGEKIVSYLEVRDVLASRLVCSDWEWVVNNFKLVWKRVQTSPLHLAARSRNLEWCRDLIENRGWEVNSRDRRKSTPLHTACAEGSLSVVRYLTDMGSDLNAVDFRGITGLHLAARERHYQVVREILRQGAKADVSDAHAHETALHLAAKLGHSGIVRLLLNHGASVDAQSK